MRAMSRIRAHYDVAVTADEVVARAGALALEQSIEMPLEAVDSAYVRDEVVARVEDVDELAAGRHRIVLGISLATTGHEIGQLMNMLFGNCSLQDDVELVDVELPPALVGTFGGPRHGLQGLRSLVGAGDRALTMTALKPQGLVPDELAALAGTFARAGVDIIKDDHGIADQARAPFAARVAACQRSVEEANTATGGHSVYAPALSGGPQQLARQLHVVREEGVQAVLVCPMLMGLPTFFELVRDALPCAVIAHPALGGVARIHPSLLFGKLFRLLGADATVFPNYGGRFSYSRETCLALARAAREPWGALRACAPVPAGGMSVARVQELLDVYGKDVILLVGGALLTAGSELAARSREFVERVRRARVSAGACAS
jgi:ribulose-bisphosphate carboxylase large chain